ncbi:glycine--tRNA ligase [Candidatus Jorgensenbacteria bacterium]|nr:glycine--tRNA ligase [Candidatus Jorgensenbacteria bacterium]
MDIFEKIYSLAKRRGFIYPGSDIYGGLAGTWDYGPLGVLLKQNIKKFFWESMVERRDDVVGLDGAILMNPRVWEASGHLESFSDPLVECKSCHKRFRADTLEGPKCPECKGELTSPKQFNLLMEAMVGVIEGEKQKVYLRGEITQGVHVNFKNVVDSTRVKIPFGIAQMGKAFRNEITPGQFTFRSREFEQMELQFYVEADEKEAEKWIKYWKEERLRWYFTLGIKKENLRFREHKKDERAHYARAAYDIEYRVPGGEEWKELEGIHNRGDWDLNRHQKFSGKDLTYFDEKTKERYLPWVIETSGGIDRGLLFFLMDSYNEERVGKAEEESRIVLRLSPKLAPYKAAVFPLLANKPQLVELARKVYNQLKDIGMIAWDDRGNIGKRYRTQDEIGTPYCVTVDFESLDQEDATVRDRDSMEQVRVKITDLEKHLRDHLKLRV